MGNARRLNLEAIETSLRAVQTQFSVINRTLLTPRDPLSDCVLERLMLGYRQVDALLAAGVDPFAPGSSKRVLELNVLVLCGADQALREECTQLVEATSQRFYALGDGGIESLVNWVRSMQGESIWRRAGSAYIHLLSQPQLFIEGNHRTGALIMSWMLARAGKPPFVLSVDNAKAYFDPSTVAKNARKHTLRMVLERPKLVKRFADLLKQEAEKEHTLG
jgi:prophage maintenance system killer protein